MATKKLEQGRGGGGPSSPTAISTRQSQSDNYSPIRKQVTPDTITSHIPIGKLSEKDWKKTHKILQEKAVCHGEIFEV